MPYVKPGTNKKLQSWMMDQCQDDWPPILTPKSLKFRFSLHMVKDDGSPILAPKILKFKISSRIPEGL